MGLTDWFAAEDDLTLLLNYEPYRSHLLNLPTRTYFGSKDRRVCRYCGRTPELVAFRNEAHAVPHFTGNNSLFSHDECDGCNKFFSETVEDSFAKLILPLRTVHGIAGKTGVPSYKTRDKAVRIDIDASDRHIAVTDRKPAPFFADDRENRTLTASLETQPYVPILAYKCLVKMALAIMPREELPNFTDTAKWLLEKPDGPSLDRVRGAGCYFYDFLVSAPASVALLRRRTIDTPLPYMLFILILGRNAFQIHLPLTPMDNCFTGTTVRLPRIGAAFVPGMGESHVNALRLNSSELVRDEVFNVVMSYETHTETIKPSAAG